MAEAVRAEGTEKPVQWSLANLKGAAEVLINM